MFVIRKPNKYFLYYKDALYSSKQSQYRASFCIKMRLNRELPRIRKIIHDVNIMHGVQKGDTQQKVLTLFKSNNRSNVFKRGEGELNARR